MTISPIEYASPDYDLAVRLRTEVLRKPLGLEFTAEQLAAEWADHHFGCFDENENLVGCLILTKKDEKVVKMRQVAVAADRQGMGIGQAMVAWSEVWAARNGFEAISLHARETAVPFYLKMGYEQIGDRFMEVGIGHFLMEKPPPTPPEGGSRDTRDTRDLPTGAAGSGSERTFPPPGRAVT